MIDPIGTIEVESKQDMRVLGVIFSCHLNWETHVQSIIAKCKSSALKKIRHKFIVDQLLKIITCQYYN